MVSTYKILSNANSLDSNQSLLPLKYLQSSSSVNFDTLPFLPQCNKVHPNLISFLTSINNILVKLFRHIFRYTFNTPV